ncbi:hypothetical protein J6X90_03205 [Candidatus Saccharibacteria bacterium]|nr:hypothetical protein [Candidatus Saccharibacteria bacterium]
MKKNKRVVPILPILLVLFVIAAATGWGIVVYQYGEIKSRDNEIAQLKDNNYDLNVKVDDLTVVDDPYANFLKTNSWEVMFPYIDNVTKVKAETGNIADGSFFIKSIETNDKTYDVDLCGGENEYKTQPFYLGQIVRWSNSEKHEEGAEDPTQDSARFSRIFVTNNYSYYFDIKKSGCVTNQENEDYLEGVRLASEMLHKITGKEE